MFTEGLDPENPPANGHLIDASSDPALGGWDDLAHLMNGVEKRIGAETVTADNLDEHLSDTYNYIRIQRHIQSTRPVVPENDNELEDLVELATQAKLEFGDDVTLPAGNVENPQLGDLYKGAATMEEVIDRLGTLISVESWKKMINKNATRIMPSRQQSAEWIASLILGISSRSTHGNAILMSDTFAQAKALIESTNILPEGDTAFTDGAVDALTLYAGAESEDSAAESMVREVATFAAANPVEKLPTAKKLRLRRIFSNLNKKALLKENQIAEAIKNKKDVPRKDIVSYEKDAGLSDRYFNADSGGVKLDFSSGDHITADDGVAENVPGISDTAPSFDPGFDVPHTELPFVPAHY
ncbi:hypothetical protein HDU88_004018 [Geranomyces variabilis]|nr:hypothetical protein HDU88_004018 [Geranomyces variabilis]